LSKLAAVSDSLQQSSVDSQSTVRQCDSKSKFVFWSSRAPVSAPKPPVPIEARRQFSSVPPHTVE